MRKRILSILLCSLLIFSFSACSAEDITKALQSAGSASKDDGTFRYSSADSSDLEVRSYDGDSRAALTLGLRFDYGIQGEHQNYQEALNWYETSANLGNSNACVHLGYMLLFGLGTEKDLNRSLEYFERAVDAGNYDGYAGLGRYYLVNSDLPDAAANAYANIQAAEQQGNAMGTYLMGYCYEKGIGVTADADQAASYYEKLTSTKIKDISKVNRYPYQEAYVRRALLYLGKLLPENPDNASANGNASASETDSADSTDTTRNSKEAKEALSLLKSASDTSYAPALYYLGLVYEKGIGAGVSYANARTYFEKAAKQDYAPALNRLGYLYFNGLGVDASYTRAAYYQKLAAAQGYAPAQVNLGYLYENGLGVDQDLPVARSYYQMAADSGFQGAAESVLRVDQKIAQPAG